MDRGGTETADEAAARWAARLNARSVTTEELDHFYAWRREPGNEAAYARAERVWRDARDLGEDPDIAAAIDAALERPTRPGFWPLLARRRLLLGGLVAAPIAVAGGAWWTLQEAKVHETAPGERLAIVLADGSRVDLNTDTRIVVRLDKDARHIELERGEAMFAVKPDATRPFLVTAAGKSVRALGTRFSTYRTRDALQVVLVSGKVAVASAGAPILHLDQPGATAFARTGNATTRGKVDLDLATAWTTGKLLFRQTPLADAVAEMNRYSRRQLDLSDPALGRLKVEGLFDTGDTDSFVAAVSTIFALHARRDDDRIILEPMNGADAKK